jgi:hypothetical protein
LSSSFLLQVHFWFYHFASAASPKLQKRIDKKAGGNYVWVAPGKLEEHLAETLQLRSMGPDYYTYRTGYRAMDGKLITDYRLSRILPFVTVGGIAVYEWLANR